MIEVRGMYTNATIMSYMPDDEIEKRSMSHVMAQLESICNYKIFSNSIIKVMPDVHPAKIGPVGLTMTIKDAVMPNLIGVDIGCGISMIKLGKIKKDFQKLDTVIRERIPVGFNNRSQPLNEALKFDISALKCKDNISNSLPFQALGTLGGGNHFIEVDVDEENQYYLIIHSGSRSVGVHVTEYYLEKGNQILHSNDINFPNNTPYEMTYLTGELMKDYLHDLEVVQKYADFNRYLMIEQICTGMKWKWDNEWWDGENPITTCMHNYIDKNNVLRKGAISAHEGEDIIIPINMRDGTILGKGKGNEKWNYSAPHGSGRIYSRKEVANYHTVNEFKKQMKDVYSICIGPDTLDEAPFAYRNIDYIKESIQDTVDITKILKPVYNYKAGGNK